jgi:hypothetical protein
MENVRLGVERVPGRLSRQQKEDRKLVLVAWWS